MAQQPPLSVMDELIIEQAIAYAKQSGWSVMAADCHVQTSASMALMRSGTPDAWYVFMSAQPPHNPRLQKPMPLGCQVQLLGERLCAVHLYEPSDRQPYLKR